MVIKTSSLQPAVNHPQQPMLHKGPIKLLAGEELKNYLEEVQERLDVSMLRQQKERTGRIRSLDFDSF